MYRRIYIYIEREREMFARGAALRVGTGRGHQTYDLCFMYI